MRITESQIRKVVREELINEMDAVTGLAVVGGAYLAFKGLAFLVSIVGGIKNGVMAGFEEAKFHNRALTGMVLDPEMKPILVKLRNNKEIIDPLSRGDLDTAAQKIQESGILTPEEMTFIQGKFNFMKGVTKLNKMATRSKYGIPD